MADEFEPELQPAWQQFYLYRVEMYLVHKYAPQMIDELNVTFARARRRREGVVKHSEIVIRSKEELMARIQTDLQTYAPWKPKNSSHKKGSLERPNIGQQYQREFTEL